MLKLNYNKTEFIVFSSPRMKHLLSDVTLKVSDSVSLSPGTSVKILGVTFDSVMKMDQHVTSLCRSLHYHLSNISRIRPYINKEACEHAVRTLISTRLDYANSLLFRRPHHVSRRRGFAFIFFIFFKAMKPDNIKSSSRM